LDKATVEDITLSLNIVKNHMIENNVSFLAIQKHSDVNIESILNNVFSQNLDKVIIISEPITIKFD
jgi:hypothetical protein